VSNQKREKKKWDDRSEGFFKKGKPSSQHAKTRTGRRVTKRQKQKKKKKKKGLGTLFGERREEKRKCGHGASDSRAGGKGTGLPATAGPVSECEEEGRLDGTGGFRDH